MESWPAQPMRGRQLPGWPGTQSATTTGHGLQGEERWRTASSPVPASDAESVRAPSAGTHVVGASRKEPIRVLVVDDHALFRRGLEIVLAQEEDIQVVGEAGDGAEAVGEGRGPAARHRADGRADAQAGRHRGLHLHQGGGPQREDHHADDQRRGGRPLRGDQGGRHRLSAQGDLHGRGGHRDPRRGRRPVADQPVDGVEAAHRVQVDDPADRRAPAACPRPG